MQKFLIIGCGAVGRGLIPLLREHFPDTKLEVITADERGSDVCLDYDVPFTIQPLTYDNYRPILYDRGLKEGDVVINVSVGVYSIALMEWCRMYDVMYLDTVVEPWEGGYVGRSGEIVTNMMLRNAALSLGRNGPTAAICCGANPGLITHLLKEALLWASPQCAGKKSFREIAKDIGVKTIQVSEVDTQCDERAKNGVYPGQFFNTWSVDGFLSELYQHAEVGWGSHETRIPEGGELYFGRSMILASQSAYTKVETWTPKTGAVDAYLVSHHEAHSIADLLTAYKDGKIDYRPTVYYAYHPCEFARKSIELSKIHDVEKKIIINGWGDDQYDALGVLVTYDKHHTGSFWYGSILTSSDVITAYNSPTTMQVNANIIGTLKWMMENSWRGVVEAEDMDHKFILKYALPYLGEVKGFMNQGWLPGNQLTFSYKVEGEV